MNLLGRIKGAIEQRRQNKKYRNILDEQAKMHPERANGKYLILSIEKMNEDGRPQYTLHTANYREKAEEFYENIPKEKRTIPPRYYPSI